MFRTRSSRPEVQKVEVGKPAQLEIPASEKKPSDKEARKQRHQELVRQKEQTTVAYGEARDKVRALEYELVHAQQRMHPFKFRSHPNHRKLHMLKERKEFLQRSLNKLDQLIAQEGDSEE